MSAPDDRHPESGDASHFDFDDLVLDEDFVRAATISEASATARVERKREQQIRRARRFPRPQVRNLRRGWHQWTTSRPDDRRTRPAPEAPRVSEWSAGQWSAVVVAVVLAGLFIWTLSGSNSKAHTAATAAAISQKTPPGADPVGTCRGVQSSGQVATSAVPCTQVHSVEITGYVAIAAPSISGAELASVQTGCEQAALIYAGGTLPSTVKSSELAPTVAQWNSGDRSAECTIFQVDTSGSLTPFTGTLKNSENG